MAARIALLMMGLLATTIPAANSQEILPNAKPVPIMQVIPQPHDQAAVLRDGIEISRYYFGKELNRPFLFPMIGPSGKSVTRMGHPRDPNSHSHHNSVWISHHDVAGVDFWGDTSKARIVHQRVVRYEDLDEEAIIEVSNQWNDATGKTLLQEQRRMRFLPLPEKQWLLVLDLTFTPKTDPVVLGKTPFGMIGVRMAKTIGVHDGGGRIRNSEGGIDEEGVFWKNAKWVDYSGPITNQLNEGATLFDHPQNPHHPSAFHVRNDGWMEASSNKDQSLEITKDKPLKLRYGIFIHAGVPALVDLEKQYQHFVSLAEPNLPPKSK